jgi:peptidoglycan hydrolase-like protein with peptidoglycan-binding domain
LGLSSATSSVASTTTASELFPAIINFFVSSTIITNGSSSLLTWTTTGADTVSINHGIGSQAATSTGSVTVSPTSTTIYILTAANTYGSSTAQATITVDNNSPTAPTALSANPTSANEVDLSWASSTDDTGVAGYAVFRDSSQIGTTTSLGYADTGLSASTLYTYFIEAYDAVGHFSLQSASTTATTQAASSGGGGGGGGGSGGGISVSGGGGGGGGGSSYIPPVTTTVTTAATTTIGGAVDNVATLQSLLQIIQAVRSLSAQMLITANGGRNLTIGSTGQDVWALQVFLLMNNILSPTGPRGAQLTSPTSYFGTQTAGALSEFQVFAGLPATGFFSVLTRAVIQTFATNAISTPSSATPNATIATTIPTTANSLELGDQGVQVSALQAALEAQGYLSAQFAVPGLFDPATLRAVQAFQCLEKIACSAADSGYGVVGPKTKTALGL